MRRAPVCLCNFLYTGLFGLKGFHSSAISSHLKIHFDINNLSKSYFETKANIKSINTSNKTRDKHLNAPDYFNTEKYPYITFKSENLKFEGSDFVLSGIMTIKNISRSEDIRFTFEDNTFIGRAVMYSNDYGIKKQKTREDSKILIKISVPVL